MADKERDYISLAVLKLESDVNLKKNCSSKSYGMC